MSAIASGAYKDNDMGEGTPAVAMSRWCTRVQTYTSIRVYYVLLYNMHMNFVCECILYISGRTSNPYTYEYINT